MASPPLPRDLESRRAQMFPTLSEPDRERLTRFGQVVHFRDGERMVEAGVAGPGMHVILRGSAQATRRDGLGHSRPIVEQGPGSFFAEVGQLSGRPALVDIDAVGDVEALLIPPERLRALLVAEAELGERIMRALILRRVGLIETGAGGPILVGPPDDADTVRLQGFLARNGHPYSVLDPASDPDAQALLSRYCWRERELPLAVLPNGSVLKNPSEEQLAHALGMLADEAPDTLYDVAVVGAGPGGLATAVYAASEGLRVLVLDAHAFGGQAGASARIENYLGFPTGISGQALAGRAYVQAQKFGAEMAIPTRVARLRCEAPGRPLLLELADGRRVRARSVVVASGASYRRPALANLNQFEGRGVSYWASPIEGRMCGGEEVLLVGGGNSAGQAAVFLAGHARRVRVLVRGPGLAESMSSYLIERMTASPRIELQLETEVVALEGSRAAGLQRVRVRHRPTGREVDHDVRHLFLFIGADPATEWLTGCGVKLDAKGFVRTGAEALGEDAPWQERLPLPLESSVPGVFAVGDVRSGSVKRVGGAIGEGAAVVAQVHAYLAHAMEARGARVGGGAEAVQHA
ncbi:cyclic nucleotide-binding domain-containing protein [Aggregicoccus sp. 17bor-14]|uniref:FAD-dependent oxidoreductase n=1 Tax=Myxococcaceae TaxID=31 RepID=UPI00129C4F8F|nr:MULTISPECIES: cyclic nucleotide-binding domain-containing thioredoxin-disulfide reductase [Myxococcaceae]MBF5045880.1 FAD-dependent oxidoreductase [Simulacricoccus sp. 17bor-14]MRI91614.1 cyclic nucleotide-binding domain-containing protein [Aggregicoccus sp. 17bor-14]